MSSQHPEQKAEQAADRLPAHREEERATGAAGRGQGGETQQPVVRRGMFGARTTGDTSGFGRLVVRQSPKVSSERPYGGPRTTGAEGEFDEVANLLQAAYPAFEEAIERVVVDRGELTFVVRREHLLGVVRVLRDDPRLRFEMCLGVSGVHYPAETGAELHAAYPFLSITHNRRVRVEVTCPDADPHIPSIVSVYPTNNWHERETYDFFGLIFDGHPALTRIMMPDDWMGHPQRKDYPLGGIPVEYRGAKVPPPDDRRSYV
jgi:NADH-quinone oxidoreductase subunit C